LFYSKVESSISAHDFEAFAEILKKERESGEDDVS
jgi:hypothetical protein